MPSRLPGSGFLKTFYNAVKLEFQKGYSPSYTHYSLTDVRQLDSKGFETLVSDVWEKKGFETTLTSDGPDQGIDVLATSDGRTVAIQAKRYDEDNKVGAATIRKVVGAASQVGADSMVVVTTSSYTSPAQEAADNLGVELVDGDNLIALMNSS